MLTNSTVSGNSVGGEVLAFDAGIEGEATLTNSIVANESTGDHTNCSGPSYITDNGGNFSDDASCGAGFAAITPGVDFDTTLADNGGPTPTHALLHGSPAIDAIPPEDCTYDDDGDPGTPEVPLTEDQRGVARPLTGDGAPPTGCDAGAYEVTQCADGLHNDGDGRIDFDGGVTAGLPPEEQTEPDLQCVGPLDKREKSRCGLGFELVLVLSVLLGMRATRKRWLRGRSNPGSALLVLALVLGGSPAHSEPEVFELVEATIMEMQEALGSGLLTSEMLTGMYLTRIATYDSAGPGLNSYLHVNENAIVTAGELDALRGSEPAPGPLYGIPVLLKDNVDTADMPTTAGSVALAGSFPSSDAFITRRLRDAGAIVLGKATMTEFANFLTLGMPAGYSSHGGYGFNPYDPRPLPGGDGRPVLSPGGSSSGSAIAVSANLIAVAVGTETSGSLLDPASRNGVAAIKPTLGLVSRTGILPISSDQDTAGPLARTVGDAAILLGVMAGYDPDDPATEACLVPGNCHADYTQFLDPNALQGARIAVPPSSSEIVAAAVDVLIVQGAHVEMIDPLPGVAVPSILLYGFKRDLNAYLDALPAAWPVRTLSDVIAFNLATPGALKYGQILAFLSDLLDTSPGSADTLTYLANREAALASSLAILDAVYHGADGIAGTEDDFDALLDPGAETPARAGYPSVTVPGGFLPPAGEVVNPHPRNVVFSGPAFSEPRLIALAYAFEQATRHRLPPASVPPLPTDTVVRPGPERMRVDIKPGSCPNAWNRNGKGVLPVALLGTAAFDVSWIDVGSVRLCLPGEDPADPDAACAAPNEGPPGPHTVVADVGTPFDGDVCECHALEGDGLLDLSMKFRTQTVVAALGLEGADPGALVELVVAGTLVDGTRFEGADCVRLVPPGTPPGLVRVHSNASGAWIDVAPLDDQLDGGGFASFERTYPQSSALVLAASARHGRRTFRGWRVDGGDLVEGTSLSLTVAAPEQLVEAIYSQPPCGLGYELALLLVPALRRRGRVKRGVSLGGQSPRPGG